MSSRRGSFRSSVQIQALTETPNAYGQPIKSWATVATLPCLVRSPTGRELLNAGQMKAVMWHVIECDWPGSIVTVAPSHRVLFNGSQYGIEAIENVGMKNRRMIIHCTEQVLPSNPS